MDKIIEYIKEREKDLGYWAGGLDDGTYSSAMETYQKVIEMLERKEAEDDTMDNDIVEIITHTYYADGKVIKTESEYKYKKKLLTVEESTCPPIPIEFHEP